MLCVHFLCRRKDSQMKYSLPTSKSNTLSTFFFFFLSLSHFVSVFLTVCLWCIRLSEFPGKESLLLTVRVHLLPSGEKRPRRSAQPSSQWWEFTGVANRSVSSCCLRQLLTFVVCWWSHVVSSAFLPPCFLLKRAPGSVVSSSSSHQAWQADSTSPRAVHSSPWLSPSPSHRINIPFFGPRSLSERDPLIGAG